MRDYARNDEANDEQQLTAVLNYIKKAHGIYLEAIYSFIEKAEGKRKNEESVPALPRVRRLLSTYDSSVTERLQRYYEKAKLSPEKRSELSTGSVSEATRRSRLSDESRTIIHRMQLQHNKELSKLNDKLVDVTVSAEIAGIERKRLENQIKTTECEREPLSSRIKKMSESVTKITIDKKVQKEVVFKERSEMLKQNLRLQKELLDCKAIATEGLFSDAANPSYLLPNREKHSATNPTMLRPYQSTASVGLRMPHTNQALIAAAHEPDQPCCSTDLFAEPTTFVQHTGFQNPTLRLGSGKKNDKDVPRQLENSAKGRTENTASEFRTGGSMLRI